MSLIISIFTALYGAFSDVVGKKTMMQFYMMITFVSQCASTFLITMEYSADFLIYPYYLYYTGGSVTVLFAIVFAHVVEVTPINMRQIGIILMEMMMYMAELSLLPFGFIIDKYGLTGIKFLSWTLCLCQFIARVLTKLNFQNLNFKMANTLFIAVVTFALTYRNDVYSDEAKTLKQNFVSLFSGMRKVWFTRDPALFVIPLAIAFFFMFMSFSGSFYILFNYTQGPPFSMNSAGWFLLLGVRGFMSIFASISLLIIQERL